MSGSQSEVGHSAVRRGATERQPSTAFVSSTDGAIARKPVPVKEEHSHVKHDPLPSLPISLASTPPLNNPHQDQKTSLWYRLTADKWFWEILAVGLSLSNIASICAILLFFNGKPAPELPRGITVCFARDSCHTFC